VITSREPRLRLRGHGRRLRLHASRGGDVDPLRLMSECCRTNLALDKALGEAITTARAAGKDWPEIAGALAAAGETVTRDALIEERLHQQRLVWQRFWPGDR